MILKNLFLCEAASMNPDNTFSVFRGGINIFNLVVPANGNHANLPPIKMALVATVELEITEMGRLHTMEVIMMDADGRRQLPEIRNHFQPPAGQHKCYHNLIVDLYAPFHQPGVYAFYVNVDGHELGSLPFTIIFHQTQATTTP